MDPEFNYWWKVATGEIEEESDKKHRTSGIDVFKVWRRGVLTSTESFEGVLGQFVHIYLQNLNALNGVRIAVDLFKPWLETKGPILLLPFMKTKFVFNRLGNHAETWNFNIRSESDVTILEYRIESNFVPGQE